MPKALILNIIVGASVSVKVARCGFMAMKAALGVLVAGVLSFDAQAVPPVNDSFENRINLGNAASIATTGTTLEATVEQLGQNMEHPARNTVGHSTSHTVWWEWTAAVTGWVSINTNGSNRNTVLSVFTGDSLPITSGSLVAWKKNRNPETSDSVNFQATAGTAYNICVGIEDGSVSTGAVPGIPGPVNLQIITGAEAVPPVIPIGFTISPASADVTSSSVPGTFTLTAGINNPAALTAWGTSGYGAELNFSYMFPVADLTFGTSAQGTVNQAGTIVNYPASGFTIPRYFLPGTWNPVITLGPCTFGLPTSGTGYILPVGMRNTITLINDGSIDIAPPVLTSLNVTPSSVDPTTETKTVTVRITATDDLSGISQVSCHLTGFSPSAMERISGSDIDGTWQAIIQIPQGTAYGSYSLFVDLKDHLGHSVALGANPSADYPAGAIHTLTIGPSSPSAPVAPPAIASQFEFDPESSTGPGKFTFDTIPGRRYRLWRSTDLSSWVVVSGYPLVATAEAMEHYFNKVEREFFRIEPIDEQPPDIEDQFPPVDGFAIRRFEDLRFLLKDVTGVNPASIQLTVDGGAPLFINSPGVSFRDGILSYDSGDAALGAYGATIPVTLTVKDVLGHTLTHAFSFKLEVQPKVRSNLYVFGSPAAQRSGQRIPATPTAVLANRGAGPVAMGDADPWSIEAVTPDAIVIAYTGAAPPVFLPDTYLANLTPVRIQDIFYRKILSVEDVPTTKKLTLNTIDVSLADIAEESTCSLSSSSIIYNTGNGGVIQPAVELNYSKIFPRVGISLDGEGALPLPGLPNFSIHLPEANIWLTPSLNIAFETKEFSVQRLAISVQGDLEAALKPSLNYLPYGSEKEKSTDLHAPISRIVFQGLVGPMPVWLDLTYTTKLKIDAEANAGLTLTTGFRRNLSLNANVTYHKDSTPRTTWSRSATASLLQQMPVTLSLAGTATAKVALVPQLDVRLLSLIGFYVNVNPRLEAEITANGGFSFSQQSGKFTMAPTGTATVTGGFLADLNAGMSILAVDQEHLPAMEPYQIYSKTWGGTYPNEAPPGFSLIPAGTFSMGDQSSPRVGYDYELPVRSIYVSDFFMGQTEVTKAQWDATATYAVANGYSFSGSAAGKAYNHPVHSVTWSDAVKWCNAKSQQENLIPCYYVHGSIYKTGEINPFCDFTRNGYRLPTEAEWEKAARGGLSGKNFPWGDTISHDQANYYSVTSHLYDLSPTSGFHPTYSGNPPFTSPVGSFAPNAFGLLDMTGNVWEWCWDWHGVYSASAGPNPKGPDRSDILSRVFRGGAWHHSANYSRVSNRGYGYEPAYWNPNWNEQDLGGVGFRLARTRL